MNKRKLKWRRYGSRCNWWYASEPWDIHLTNPKDPNYPGYYLELTRPVPLAVGRKMAQHLVDNFPEVFKEDVR